MNQSSVVKALASLPGLLCALLVAAPSAHAADKWDLDPAHCYVGFAVNHAGISKVRGSFSEVSGQLDLNEKDPSKSSIDISVDVSSIYSGMSKRDDHLRSEDFFNVNKFPTMQFKSRKVVAKGKKYDVQGDLTIRDVTKPVTLSVEGLNKKGKDPFGNVRVAASAIGKIDRRDFGLTWNKNLEKAGELLVGNEVLIEIDVEFIEVKEKEGVKTAAGE